MKDRHPLFQTDNILGMQRKNNVILSNALQQTLLEKYGENILDKINIAWRSYMEKDTQKVLAEELYIVPNSLRKWASHGRKELKLIRNHNLGYKFLNKYSGSKILERYEHIFDELLLYLRKSSPEIRKFRREYSGTTDGKPREISFQYYLSLLVEIFKENTIPWKLIDRLLKEQVSYDQRLKEVLGKHFNMDSLRKHHKRFCKANKPIPTKIKKPGSGRKGRTI